MAQNPRIGSNAPRLPQIRYARNGGVAIAYQVVGDGDADLVYVPEWTSNLVYWWEYPRWRDFYLRLARSFLLILFDRRGTRLSDHGGQFAALETRMEDLHAVLDSAGSSKPVICGADEGRSAAGRLPGSLSEEEAAWMDVASQIPGARTMRVSGTDPGAIFLSPEIADEIDRFVAGEEAPTVPESVLATVVFTDIVGSTDHAVRIGDRAWRDLLARHHALVRRELARFRGHERDTAGDGFFATFDGPARAIRAAQAIVDGVRTLGLEARIGIHVGECELHDGKIAGLAVNIGSRVASNAGPGAVLVSQTVRHLGDGPGIRFEDRAGA